MFFRVSGLARSAEPVAPSTPDVGSSPRAGPSGVGEERAATFTDRITVWSSLIKSSDRKYGNNKISVRAQHHCTSLHCTGH